LDLIEGLEADEELERCKCKCNLGLVVLIAVFLRVFLVYAGSKILVRMDSEGKCLGHREDLGQCAVNKRRSSNGRLVGKTLGRNGRSAANFFNTVFPINFSLWAFRTSLRVSPIDST
jgi:hypothetical protein